MNLNAGIEITWLGHATFKIKTPGGKNVLIDPWVHGNPACPDDLKKTAANDLNLILITHGHFDHIGDAVTVAKDSNAQVVCIYETANWLTGKGLKDVVGMNKGGTYETDGIKITMVNAIHSCGILDDDGKIIYGGDPCGYVVEFENGYKIYHAGDTAVFGDMAIIAELYQPNVVFLPIGDFYTMGVREAAHACKLMRPKHVIPMHYGTFPALHGRPSQLLDLIKHDLPETEVADVQPGAIIR